MIMIIMIPIIMLKFKTLFSNKATVWIFVLKDSALLSVLNP